MSKNEEPQTSRSITFLGRLAERFCKYGYRKPELLPQYIAVKHEGSPTAHLGEKICKSLGDTNKKVFPIFRSSSSSDCSPFDEEFNFDVDKLEKRTLSLPGMQRVKIEDSKLTDWTLLPPK